jgi:hypothetical protein
MMSVHTMAMEKVCLHWGFCVLSCLCTYFHLGFCTAADARWRPRGCSIPDLWFDVQNYDTDELQRAVSGRGGPGAGAPGEVGNRAGGGAEAGVAAAAPAGAAKVAAAECLVLDVEEGEEEVASTGGGAVAGAGAGGAGPQGAAKAAGVVDLTLSDSEEEAAGPGPSGAQQGLAVGQKRQRGLQEGAGRAAKRPARMEEVIVISDDDDDDD